jgi:hypothetical protein
MIGAHHTDVGACHLRQFATSPDLRQVCEWRHLIAPERIVSFVGGRDGFRYLGTGANQQSTAFTGRVPLRMRLNCVEYRPSDAHQISGACGAWCLWVPGASGP